MTDRARDYRGRITASLWHRTRAGMICIVPEARGQRFGMRSIIGR
jgi:hypothetical protein